MRYETWNGGEVAGLSPDTIREAHPVPEGGILLLGYDDDGMLAVMQNVMPGAAGAQAITEQNRHVAIRRLEAVFGASTTTGSTEPSPAART